MILRTKTSYFLLFLMGLGVHLFAQPDSTELEERQQIMFDELFFDAMRFRAIENYEKTIEKLEACLEIQAENPIVFYELSKAHLQEDHADRALYYAKLAEELDDENTYILNHLRRLLNKAGEYEQEIDVLEKLLDLEPENTGYILFLSEAYAGLGEYKKAIKILNAVEKEIGIIPEISERKKNLWLAANKPKKAEKELQNLIKSDPDEPNYYGVLAQFYRANGKQKKAFETYEKLLELHPNDPRAHFDLAEMYREEGRNEKFMYHLRIAMKSPEIELDARMGVLISLFNVAIRAPELGAALEEMLKNAADFHPESPEVMALMGDFLVSRNRATEAARAYERAIELPDGKRFEIYQQLLRIYLQNSDYENACRIGEQTTDLYPNQVEAYLYYGVAAMELKKWDKAAQAFSDGLDLVFGNRELKAEFHSLLGESYHRLGEHSKSDEQYDAALAIKERDAVTLNNYAYYLSLRNEKMDKALEMTKKSNQLSPNNAVYLDTWAWVHYIRGEYKEALEVIQQAIEFGGHREGEIVAHYGDILYKLGKIDEAKVQWKKAKELGYEEEEMEKKIGNR